MIEYNTPVETNNPALRGSLAGLKILFGECNRYAVAPIHTRFDDIQWFVWDAHVLDRDGLPEVIRQANGFSEAVKGL